MKLIELNEYIEALEDTLESMEDISPEEEIEVVKEMLEKFEGDRAEKLINVARWRKQLMDESKGVIAEEIRRLQTRKRVYDRRVDSLAEYLKFGLSTVGGAIKHPLGNLREQNNSRPSVHIQNINLIPPAYWRDVEVLEIGGLVELRAGEYRVYVDGDKVSLATVDRDAIAEYWQETGKQVPGTMTIRGTHIRLS